MQSMSVFADIANFADIRWKNTDVSRTYKVCHVIHVVFESSLAKVYLCQILLL